MKFVKWCCTLLLFCAIGCGEDDHIIFTDGLSGKAQKGPFNSGSVITVQALGSDLNPTGTSFATTTNSLGEFSLDSRIEGEYIEIIAVGSYYNEVTGETSDGAATLRALVQVAPNLEANVNVLTTLSYERIRRLMLTEQKSYDEASIQAQQEILDAFNIVTAETLDFTQLDLLQEGEGNAILLACSIILQGTTSTSQMQETMNSFINSYKNDGVMDRESVLSSLIRNSDNINPEDIKQIISEKHGIVNGFEEFLGLIKLILTYEVLDVSNTGGSNGSINLSVSGGDQPYSFQWSNGESTEDIDNLTVGTYTIIVSDANGLVSNADINVKEPITLEADIVDIACFGDQASIGLNIAGGMPPYTINWALEGSNFTSTSEDLQDLSDPGTYSVKVTDQFETEVTESYQILENSEIVIIFNESRPEPGTNTGTLEISIEGGVPPYQVEWSNGQTKTIADQLYSGWYTATVTDSKGCIQEAKKLLYGEFTDSRDGRSYKTIKIGNQIWMAENLRATSYTNGDVIPKFPGDWYDVTAFQAYYWGDGACTNCNWYNGFAINPQMLCPTGWELPSKEDWEALIDSQGTGPGVKLKDVSGWYNLYDNRVGPATNESGFTARGAGSKRDFGGTDPDYGSNGYWWSISPVNSDTTRVYVLQLSNNADWAGIGAVYKDYGANCRCIKK